MANELRVRQQGLAGVLSAILAQSVTTMQSARLANLGVIDTTNHAVFTLYDENLNYEVVRVTAHTAAATSATIVSVAGTRPAAGWPTGTKWKHGPVLDDFLLAVANAAARNALTPYTGQYVYQLDTKVLWAWDGTAWTPRRTPCARIVVGNAGLGSQVAGTFVLAQIVTTDFNHGMTTSTGRLTCDVAGVYRVHFHISAGSNNQACLAVQVRKNSGGAAGGGTAVVTDWDHESGAIAAGYGRSATAEAMISMAAGDYFEGFVSQNSGGTYSYDGFMSAEFVSA